eukprot:13981648-Ditylum_brightwellii.AAC.1
MEDLGDKKENVDDTIIPEGINLNEYTNFVDLDEEHGKELNHFGNLTNRFFANKYLDLLSVEGIADIVSKMSIKKA